MPRKGSPTKTQLRLPGFLESQSVSRSGVSSILNGMFRWMSGIIAIFNFRSSGPRVSKALRFRLAYWLWWRWLAHVQFNGQDAWMVKLMDPFYAEQDGWKRERLYRPDVGLDRVEKTLS